MIRQATPLMHETLVRQMSRYLTDTLRNHPEIEPFVQAVNESYIDYERNRVYHDLVPEPQPVAYTGQQAPVQTLIAAMQALAAREQLDPFPLTEDNLLGIVECVETQITARNMMATELKQAQLEADQAAHAKSAFLSTISHELRTPLNAIVGLTYLMQQEPTTPPLSDHLRMLQQSADSLHRLVNDILDFNKIEAGALTLSKTTFDLRQLLSTLQKDYLPKAGERHNDIRLQIDNSLPQRVVGDAVRLGQIISILLDNAIRYTEHGHITLELLQQQRSSRQVDLYVAVSDTGVGIEPTRQSMILESFSQSNRSQNQSFVGSGLGMARTLLQLFGSDISLHSEPGKGTTFSFRIALELGPDEYRSGAVVDLEPNPQTLNGLRVLLVDDYPINICLASRLLENWKIVVEVAENGRLALNKFTPDRYDLILMDLQMPVMDGYTATREIRKQDPFMPIVALTASATPADYERAVQAGVTDYVTKPFNPKVLFQKMARLSGRA